MQLPEEGTLEVENATAYWDSLAKHLDTFVAAWNEEQTAPSLGEHIPEGPLLFRRMAIIELIKVDMRERARRHCLLPVEDYARRYPESLVEGEPSADLIYEDFRLRRIAGEQITPEFYKQSFPKVAAQLGRMTKHGDLPSASIAAPKPSKTWVPGDTVDDFQLLSQLGKGAFATVFLARQISMQRIVALKISSDRGSEPQALAQLDHPHIVRVFDQRSLPAAGVRLLYMQYAPGGTLLDLLQWAKKEAPDQRSGRVLVKSVAAASEKSGMGSRSESSLTRRIERSTWPETVCRIGIAIADALDYAAQRGVLHRDIKPANILLDGEGLPKLADFNVSYASKLDGATPAAYFGGSLAYMSPEQLEAAHPNHWREASDLDGRSDLYALAVVLWELLFLTRPFGGDVIAGDWTKSLESFAKRRREESPQSPRSFDPVETRLVRVLRRTLDPERDRRPSTGADMARELRLCLQPRAHDLLFGDATKRVRSSLRRWPLTWMTIVILAPNALAGAFNFLFNYSWVVEKLSHIEAARSTFHITSTTINILAFGMGWWLIYAITWPVCRGVWMIQTGKTLTREENDRLRQKALWLPNLAAWLGAAEWVVAGLGFPIMLHVLLGEFPVQGYVHFLSSLAICGMIAAAYPFFTVSLIAIRVFYPTLLAAGAAFEGEDRKIERFDQQLNAFLTIAGVVPLAGLLLLILPSLMSNELEPAKNHWSAVLIVSGLAGLGICYLISRTVRADLTALMSVTKPMSPMGVTTESVEF